MLSTDDRALARRDRDLPGLDLILDAARLACELDARLPARVADLNITSVRYKPGMSCLVGLYLSLDGQPTRASAKLFGPDQQAKLHKYQNHTPHPTKSSHAAVVLDAAPIAAWLWPHDPKLPALAALEDPERLGRLLASCLGETTTPCDRTLTTLRYKPHRRWTACVRDNNQPTALLKLASCQDAPHTLHAARRAHRIPEIRAPRVLGSSLRRGAMALAWIPGDQLDQQLDRGTATTTQLHEAGLALARAHRVTINSAWNLRHWPIRQRLDSTRRAIHALAPALEPTVDQIAHIIHDELADLPTTIIHGDCSADQLIITDTGAVLIDWDHMSLGPSVIDLGRFAATLIATGQAPDAEHALSLMAPLLDAYRSLVPPSSLTHLPAAIALGLLQLASDPFRAHAPDWSEQIHATVQAASGLCGTPTHGA